MSKNKLESGGINLLSSMWGILRERKRTHGVTISWQIRNAIDEYWKAERALSTCGIGGIYAEFSSPADAVQQMATYIKETSRDETMPMDTIEFKGLE